ncbi:cytochrome P450 [Dioszegia hungarica]|uniref:Cytochrome P450 n=1 Tax=Dioszegia hungarica TaxID=4972 RepID=A0AA38HAV7_9TREE|nr:cytochrome P450 [Dioszegia hungarica]KAI9636876.1 cytochrome P450 [Dioszegia hungarica]
MESYFTYLYISVFIGLLAYVVVYRVWTLPYANLPGPTSPSWLFGNTKQISAVEPGAKHEEWAKAYGTTYRHHILFGKSQIVTTDLTAISFIISHADEFPKPALMRKSFAFLLGEGLAVVEGDDHRRQRRVLNPCFNQQVVRGLLPTFYDMAEQLREKLLAVIEDDPDNAASPTPAKGEDVVPGGRKIDVIKYLTMCTIDIIGKAGFDWDFQALSKPKNVLAEAYDSMFSAGYIHPLAAFLQNAIPGADRIPTKYQTIMNESRATTRRIGQKLMDDKKKAIKASFDEGLQKGDDIGKDLLSICIRANMASDLAPEQRLSDEEVLAQITTFLLAGNETSSTALTWILYLLAQYPEEQKRLREESLGVDNERLSLEAISSLPYLDGVVREALRLFPPVAGRVSEAAKDMVVPLGRAVQGQDGKVMEHIKVPKGTLVNIPYRNVHISEDIFGPDAALFNPSRHIKEGQDDHLRATQNTVPGVWGNLLSFFGGARGCVGYKLALAEIKVILFVLVRGLVFEELASKPVINRHLDLVNVQRPRVVGEEAAGMQMPLMVKPLIRA